LRRLISRTSRAKRRSRQWRERTSRAARRQKRSRSIKIGPSQCARITRDDAKVSAIARSLGPRSTRHGSALRLEDVGELRQAMSVAAERHLKQEPPFKDRGDILAAPMQLNPDCGAYSKQRFNSTLSEARSRLAALDTQLRSPQPGEKRAGGSSPVRESGDASDATSTGGSTKTGTSSIAAADSGADLENTRTARAAAHTARAQPGGPEDYNGGDDAVAWTDDERSLVETCSRTAGGFFRSGEIKFTGSAVRARVTADAEVAAKAAADKARAVDVAAAAAARARILNEEAAASPSASSAAPGAAAATGAAAARGRGRGRGARGSRGGAGGARGGRSSGRVVWKGAAAELAALLAARDAEIAQLRAEVASAASAATATAPAAAPPPPSAAPRGRGRGRGGRRGRRGR